MNIRPMNPGAICTADEADIGHRVLVMIRNYNSLSHDTHIVDSQGRVFWLGGRTPCPAEETLCQIEYLGLKSSALSAPNDIRYRLPAWKIIPLEESDDA